MAEVAGYTALGATRTLHHVPKAAGRPLLEGRMLLKAGADDTEEAFTLCLGLTPPGMGPPLHLHEIDDQTHYVVRGTYDSSGDLSASSPHPARACTCPVTRRTPLRTSATSQRRSSS